jgi:hypothetical protein
LVILGGAFERAFYAYKMFNTQYSILNFQVFPTSTLYPKPSFCTQAALLQIKLSTFILQTNIIYDRGANANREYKKQCGGAGGFL